MAIGYKGRRMVTGEPKADTTDTAARTESKTASSRAQGAGVWRRIPSWMLRWDFALALALGAFFRLLWLGDTSFLGDQAELLSLGRSALAHHALLATGIRSSIGAMNPPAAVALLLPFAPLNDPIWAALAIALANIAAVALLYGLANRYLGRRVAFAATLLYATASGPITYSRFIWQQNLLAPVVILFFWTLCLGVIDHKRGWLGWNVLLWAVAIQLHPTALPLIALTLLGVYLVHREIRLRDLAYTLGALALLFAPTLAWELASRGSDLHAALGYGGKRSAIDLTAGDYLFGLFLPASQITQGSSTPHSVAAAGLLLPDAALDLLYACAQVWLAASVVAGVLTRRPLLPSKARRAGAIASGEPVVTRSTDMDGEKGGGDETLFAASRAAAHAALARPQWRFLLLLALWQGLPVLAMVRHSSPVQPHYLLPVLPATFLIAGAFLAWASRQLAIWAPRLRARLSRPAVALSSDEWNRRARNALALTVALLVAAQSYVAWAQLDAIHTGAVDTNATYYGLTLTTQRQILQVAENTANAYHTQATIAANGLLMEPLNYQAATGYASVSAYIGAECLVTPTTGGAPLVALATPPLGAADLLRQLQGARLLRTLAAPGAASIPMYLIASNAHLPGETAIAVGATASGSQSAYPVAYAIDRNGSARTQLIIRWSGAPLASGVGQPATGPQASATYWFGARAGGPVVATYSFFAQPFDAAGQALAAPLMATCGGLAWGRGADVYSAMTLPPALVSGATGQVARWRVWAQAAPLTVSRPTFGPLTLESGDLAFGPNITVASPTEIAILSRH